MIMHLYRMDFQLLHWKLSTSPLPYEIRITYDRNSNDRRQISKFIHFRPFDILQKKKQQHIWVVCVRVLYCYVTCWMLAWLPSSYWNMNEYMNIISSVRYRCDYYFNCYFVISMAYSLIFLRKNENTKWVCTTMEKQQ